MVLEKKRGPLVGLLFIVVLLLVFFWESLVPGKILFSSDGPLGANAAHYARLPDAFFGMWQDLNWLGGYVGSAFPSITYLLLLLLGPYLFAKFYAPLSLFLLALCAWFLFRELGFRPWVCWLGAAAAMMVSDFFSYACWGLGTHVLAAACTFAAVGILVSPVLSRYWLLRLALAGFATGMAVVEGFDSGAIFALYVAAVVLFRSLMLESGCAQTGPAWNLLAKRLLNGLLQVIVIAVFAIWIALHACTVLLETQITGAYRAEHERPSRVLQWDQATQWSLPKSETLRLIIPGLYGYRMDTPGGGQYWGRVGRLLSNPELMPRHSGAGPYLGIMVILGAGWAVLRARIGKGASSELSAEERRWIFFWAAAALVSLLLAWGRYAPFYRLFYSLPYASAIRNPIKFLHPLSLSMVVLFAYGLEALWRRYGSRNGELTGGIKGAFRYWWLTGEPWEKRWVRALWIVVVGTFVGWLMYASQRPELEEYLRHAYVPRESVGPIARFSISEVGWFLFFLTLGVTWWTAILCGILTGPRSRLGIGALALILLIDFYHANRFWVVYWDFTEKYSPTEITDFLAQQRGLNRVAIMPVGGSPELALLQQIYQVDWLQHSFRYYNIQSLDVVQDPRPSADNVIFKQKFYSLGAQGLLRLWQLTNTRFLVGPAGELLEQLNSLFASNKVVFRPYFTFDFRLDPVSGYVRPYKDPKGRFALLEYVDAMPRYRLYSEWEVIGDRGQLLSKLAEPDFDPNKTLFIERNPKFEQNEGKASEVEDDVQLETYTPKSLRLRVRSGGNRLLLINDRYDPHWRAWIDQQRTELLRANFLVRAIAIPPGEHVVELRFEISTLPFWVSVLAVVCNLLLIGLLPTLQKR